MESLAFISLIPLLVLLLDPLIPFLTVPTPSSATDLHLPPHVHGTVTKEMQKQKKRETDRRYRKNKKVNAHLEVKKSKQRKSTLPLNLCELFWLMLCILISQWKLTFQLCYLYIHCFLPFLLLFKQKAVQETKNKLAMTIIENEKFRQEIFHLTSQIKLIYQRVTSFFFFLPD